MAKSTNEARGLGSLRIKAAAYGLTGSLFDLSEGRHNLGDRLYLQVKGDRRSWVFVYSSPHMRQMPDGKALPRIRMMGLGVLAANRTLKSEIEAFEAANEAAEKARALLRAGLDPVDERDRERAERRALATAKANDKTFEAATDAYMQAQVWKHARYEQDWRQSLVTHVFPALGKRLVRSITATDVLAVLQPIWRSKAVTAGRIRSRIELVLSFAAFHGWRDAGASNPASWAGNLAAALPGTADVHSVTHLPALPYAQLPEFMAELRQRPEVTARALELTILTACRSGEVRGMRREEIIGSVWKIPASRYKTGRPHCVPLSPAAVALLKDLPIFTTLDGRPSEYLFANERTGQPLSPMSMIKLVDRMLEGRRDFTIHAMRSAFRDWCAEQTEVAQEVAEACLGHQIGAVERAYRRSDLLDRRRKLMEDWSSFLDTATPFAEAAARRLAARQPDVPTSGTEAADRLAGDLEGSIIPAG